MFEEQQESQPVEEIIQLIVAQLHQGSVRMDAMQNDIEATARLTAALKQDAHNLGESLSQLKGDTAELLAILTAGKGGLKVLGWIGLLVKWLGGIALAYGAIMAVIHGGIPPKA